MVGSSHHTEVLGITPLMPPRLDPWSPPACAPPSHAPLVLLGTRPSDAAEVDAPLDAAGL